MKGLIDFNVKRGFTKSFPLSGFCVFLRKFVALISITKKDFDIVNVLEVRGVELDTGSAASAVGNMDDRVWGKAGDVGKLLEVVGKFRCEKK